MADARDAADVYWVEPKTRGVLPLDGFHLSRSLAKVIRADRFETTVNLTFSDVVLQCAESAPKRETTWINSQIEVAVATLHARGHAHSVECWRGGRLVGGLYGISLGRAFFGESMFSRETNASKVALAHLVARLRIGGFVLLDCQFLTPHLVTLGAIEISRKAYLARLHEAVSGGLAGDFGALDQNSSSSDPALALTSSPPRTTLVSGPVSGWRILHSLGQTS
jgi:leucyl/phenylalanyl-tRNA---protein transferase